MMQALLSAFPGYKPVEPVQVIANAQNILPALETLLKLQFKTGGELHPLFGSSKDYIQSLSRRLARFKTRADGYKRESNGEHIIHSRIKGEYAFSGSIDATVESSAIEGTSGFRNSIRPRVIGSIVISGSAFNGNGDTFYRPPNAPYVSSPFYAFQNIEQYSLYLQLQGHIMSGDASGVLTKLTEFSRIMTDDQFGVVSKRLDGYEGLIVPMVIDSLYHCLPPAQRDHFRPMLEDRRLYAAALLIYEALNNQSHNGDTYHPQIKNSIIFGDHALNHVKRGTIEDSIIAGNWLLQDSHLVIKNSYIVGPDGAYLVNEKVIGEPSAFETVPPVLTSRDAFWERLAPHRTPAIERYRLLAGTNFKTA